VTPLARYVVFDSRQYGRKAVGESIGEMKGSQIAAFSAAGAKALGGIAEVVVYEDDNFGGASFRTLQGWSFPQDSFWNDRISSIIVISGMWRFCVDNNLGGQCVNLGVGRYPNSGAIGLPNDSISSFTYFA
jgi:hypothetical protein